MKGLPQEKLPADGLMTKNLDALTPCQLACTERFGNILKLEQETYLLRHPEVRTGCCLIFILTSFYVDSRLTTIMPDEKQ